MKLIQYITAHIALLTLTKKEFPYATAYKLVELKRRIAPKVEFYTEEERKLVERFAARDEKGKPVIKGTHFDCAGETTEEVAENIREYERLKQELNCVEDDEPIERVTLTLPHDICITPEVIEALEPFVSFEVAE